MLDDFLVRALLAGVALALAAGPLGVFVVWRRMAYFGDATSHAAILGVALGLAFALPVLPAVLAVALVMAAVVSGLAARGQAMDTALGVLAHAALAFGLLAAAFVPGARGNLDAWLFGDILAVGRGDLALIWAGAVLVAALIAWRWSRLLLTTISEDLARSAGIDPARERLVLTLALALTVAVALQLVGALLIGAMLLIPTAAARAFSRSPEAMALGAVAIGVLSSLGGLGLSIWADTQAGPSIVAVAAGVFVLTLFAPRH